MSTHNIGFYEDLTKIIFELSSNTHLISSADILRVITANSLCVQKFRTFTVHTVVVVTWRSNTQTSFPLCVHPDQYRGHLELSV